MRHVILPAMVVPLLLLGLGVWEMARATADGEELAAQRREMAGVVQRLDARTAPARGLDLEARFRAHGQTYVGPLAVQKARDALGDLDTALVIARVRSVLAPAVAACAGLVAALSVLALSGAVLLARRGRASRDALVRGFSAVRRLLPPVLGAQVLLLAACTVAAVSFEALAIPEVGDFSSGGVKLLGAAAVVVGASVWTAVKVLQQLRRTAALFTPDPMPLLGRVVAAAEAPGLWRLLDELAGRLGALKPDNVVIGLTGGFFVSSGPKLLQPGDLPLGGRTLFLPLPFLPLLRSDELSAVIGHELAHFSGSDTEYSLRFLPIYAGVERSLDAVLAAGTSQAGTVSLLTRPALRVGFFAMEQFLHAVQHWSRLREFAADAAGAAVTTEAAAARALLRTTAGERVVADTLDAAFDAPDTAPPDLVADMLHRARTGLDNPAPRLDERQPHPTDSHPPTVQRLQALHRAPTEADLVEAAAPPAPDALAGLARLFTDPDALCRRATADFLDLGRQRARAARNALEQAAAAVDPEEQALHEDVRGSSFACIGMGAVFAAAGLALLAFGLRGLGPTEAQVLGGLAVFVGLGMAAGGTMLLRRVRPPFLLLRPDGLELPGLDRPIAWDHVADLDMALDRGRISTRVLLPPHAPFPAHRPGTGRLARRRVRLDKVRHIVCFTAGLPRGMTPQGFADLIDRYRAADAARRHLAAATAAAPAPEE